MRALVLVALGIAAASFVAQTANAADNEPVRVDFHAFPGCPDAEAFFGEVQARTQHVRLATGEDQVRTFTVHITRNEATVDGELVILDPDGGPARRAVSGETCQAVVSVLALVMALAIDPRASTAPLAASTSTPTSTPPASTPTSTPPSTGPSAEPPVLIPAKAPELSPSAAAIARPESPHAHWQPSAGVHLAVFGAGAPTVLADGSVFAELATDSNKPFAPAARLSFHYTSTASIEQAPGSAALSWIFGRAEACPLRWGLARVVDVRPCALLDVGVIAARGEGLPHTQSRLRPWSTVGALARLGWMLTRWIRVEADGGAVVPLVRETYFFQPGTSVYEAPAVAGVASVGLAVLFP